MSIVYTDYTGFSFNGIKTSDLGIVRVSDGSRYNENLTANFQDKTAVIEGGDGTLYWNSFYNQRPFTLRCAFDEVTETQLRRMCQVFSARAIGPLSFYETPYKEYIVKLSTPAQISYVPFGIESDNSTESQIIHNHELGDTSEVVTRASSQQRVYKGELVVSMVAYYPFARSTHKFLEEFNDSNKAEWAESSGLLVSQTNPLGANSVDIFSTTGGSTNEWGVALYNPGDIEADFLLYLNLTKLLQAGTDVSIALQQKNGDTANQYSQIGILNLKSTLSRVYNEDTWVRFSSKSQLLEGCYQIEESDDFSDTNIIRTGSLYNKFIKSGDFFKIPVNTTTENVYDVTKTEYRIVTPSAINDNTNHCHIVYNYLFY